MILRLKRLKPTRKQDRIYAKNNRWEKRLEKVPDNPIQWSSLWLLELRVLAPLSPVGQRVSLRRAEWGSLLRTL